MLTTFWPLKIRFNSLVCSAYSISEHLLNTDLLIKQSLSYNRFSSVLFPLILNSSSLSFSIQHIHFDETYSIACGLSYELLFNDKKILYFPNLKSLILTRFISIEPVVQSLCYFSEHQLDEHALTFHHQVIRRVFFIKTHIRQWAL
jgi:hypothetical protein